MGPHKSITERLSEHAARHLSARNFDSNTKTVCGKSLSVPLSSNTSDLNDRRKPLGINHLCAIRIKLDLFFIYSKICTFHLFQREHVHACTMAVIHQIVMIQVIDIV